MLKQYPMRVDEEIWRRAKSQAALEGITLREAIERLLQAWVDGKIDLHSERKK
jgi:predicted HicB family RNase H-like nuclease